MNFNTVSIWGDSIGKGVMFDAERNRHIICRDNYETHLRSLGYEVKNFAKIGCTAPVGEEMMTEDRLAGGIAVIEFGGNDSDIDWKSVSENPEREDYFPAKVSLPNFKRAISSMIGKARARGMLPVVVTPLPVMAERYFKWVSRGLNAENILKYLGAAEFIYRWQERYDIAARECVAETGAKLFDLRALFLTQRKLPDMMSIDGIHPNDEGHALIKRAVADAVAAI